jgi:preprotein translocase subunit SecA
VIYAQRQKVLAGEDLRQNMLNFLQGVISSTVSDALSQTGGVAEEESLKAAVSRLEGVYFPKGAIRIQAQKQSAEELTQLLYDLALRVYEAKETAFTPEVMREVERVVMLRVVDEFWMDNIDAMDDLKQGIGLRAYGQHDPVIAYKEEGYEMFQAMISAIRDETIRRLFLVQLKPQQEIKRQKVAKEVSTSGTSDRTVKPQPIRNKQSKVGPNDPCPCGSGKKYKKCCMQKDKASGMEA